MVNLKTAAVALIIILGTVGVVYAAAIALTVPTNGTITSTGLTASPAAINWGTLTQGQAATRTVNLTNNSNSASSLPLNLTYTTQLGTVTWTGENRVLGPRASTTVEVTFSAYGNATVGPFEFPIYIVG